MCGRYGQTKKGLSHFAAVRQLKISFPGEVNDNYNLSPGNPTIILIATDNLLSFETGKFGYVPSYNPKALWINARSEGKESIVNSEGKKEKINLNAEDDPNYPGPFNIDKGGFAKGFKEHRCIVAVDYFIEGPKKEKLSKPFKIERIDQEPFALAGIYSYVNNTLNAGIITTAASPLLQRVGHHRSPLVLNYNEVDLWLDHDLPLTAIKKLLHPFDSGQYQAWPLSDNLRPPNRSDKPNNTRSLIKPIGEALRNE